MWSLRFHGGTLVVEGATADQLPAGFRQDDRVGHPRGHAWLYPEVLEEAEAQGVAVEDGARDWAPLAGLRHCSERTPRDYQREAVLAWQGAGMRGAVVLPTGTGKTFVAELCMAAARLPTLVVTPTLDLVSQWHAGLEVAFASEVGILGGGHHDVRPLTVTTYDSFHLHAARYGDRFGLLVFDEVHHLPAPAWLAAAESFLAPARLGLTATWEREDGREDELREILGPVVYRKEITELEGEYLADYETVRLTVRLSAEEQAAYDAARATFTDFVRRHRIPLGAPNGWQVFLRRTAQSASGRAAFKAYRESRRIAHGTERKLEVLAQILREERGRPAIVFTNDNATAYRISRELLLPCISHQTDVKERRFLLEGFEQGLFPAIVTSRVLNEGVDLPAAEVAVVLSGSGTVREHVQRLGRILRPGQGKQAVLYEVVAAGTAEERTSQRRRRHSAYR